jgi:hypothetical protein
MALRDLYSNVAVWPSIAPAVLTADTTGAAVSTANVKALAFVATCGAVVGTGNFGIKLQDSPDGTTWTDVPAALVQSDAPAVLVQNAVYRLGYIGGKAWVRPFADYVSGTSLALSVVAVVEPLMRPVP